MRYLRRSRRRDCAARRGFTLIEAALAMVIIGIGVVALLELMAAGTMSNSVGTELTTAASLANNIHEISMVLPFNDPANGASTSTKEAGGPTAYNDIWDMNGDTYSPPLDVTRHQLTAFSNWGQQVTVQSVQPDTLTASRPNNVTLPTARVTCTITHNGKIVYTASWIVTAPNS